MSWFLKTALVLAGLGLLFILAPQPSKLVEFVALAMILLGTLSADNALRLSKYGRNPGIRILAIITMGFCIVMLILWIGSHALMLLSAHFLLGK